MKNLRRVLTFISFLSISLPSIAQVADTSYLAAVKKELNTVWPKSRRINLVFHGHSVPAGYWNNHEVHTLESYPNLVLKALKAKYPYAVINVIVTALGGENSLKGAARFQTEVLVHQPDVLFIDYALNDRFSPLEKTKETLEKMVRTAQEKNIKVILVTPSPDQRIDISDPKNPLEPYAVQIKELAVQHKTGFADPYVKFQKIVKEGKLKEVMSSVNHPNEAGHQIIANEILPYF
ncbi:SGNH/GDSL hydrolase family protein [Dyadobacter aurulentus]|uniref:SGNH/GDSL hydrolase family protein n=1 Tax=Dyadobacter sp. UC 10 TaxID=2605428 RepID=UPI0011F22FDB|nr:GDSL-type esterase/lipase family protein [Dyadobacter sp. UC 10]KAA0992855.1 SGNH/GDSL hydrolase family protein [Dyadobacter sp. UC 10]